MSGITLIALIVTIIVLLILVGIAISTLVGENGLIKRAVSASVSQEIAGEKEYIKLAASAVSMDNVLSGKEMKLYEEEGNRSALETELKKNGDNGIRVQTLSSEEKNQYSGCIFKVSYTSGRVYFIDSKADCIQGEDEVHVADGDDTDITINWDLEYGTDTNEKYIKIQYIEDLVKLSELSNSATKAEDFFRQNNYIYAMKLERNLDFNSNDSYKDSTRTDFGDLNNDGKVESLKAELTARNKSENEGFIPMANSSQNYDNLPCTLDGNEKSISNLYIKANKYERISFLGCIGSHDLTVSGDIIATKVGNGNSISRVAGLTTSEVSEENCVSNINITVNSSNSLIGGITIGDNVTSSSNNGNIIVNGDSNYIGGAILIDEETEHSSENAYSIQNSGNITVTGQYNCVGGIACGNLKLNSCINNGTITANGENNTVGGIEAVAFNGNTERSIQQCTNNGNIYINGDSCYVGGIFATYDDLNLSTVLNMGTISITGDSNVIGGIGSYHHDSITLYELENRGTINLRGEDNSVGGLFGYYVWGSYEEITGDFCNSGDINILGDDSVNNTVGGLIGGFMSPGKVFYAEDAANIHSDGEIQTVDGNCVGGVIGSMSLSLTGSTSPTITDVSGMGNVFIPENNIQCIGQIDSYSDLHHIYNSASGLCIYCSGTHEHSSLNPGEGWRYNNMDGTGVCDICGYVCHHESSKSFRQGFGCDICGYICDHDFMGGVICTKCGYTCEHNEWMDNSGMGYYECKTCGMRCYHENANGSSTCPDCGAWIDP